MTKVRARRIRKELGISRNTVTKYIDFFKLYRLTPEVVYIDHPIQAKVVW